MKKSHLMSFLVITIACTTQAVLSKDNLTLIDRDGRQVCKTQFDSLTGWFPGLYIGQVEGKHENQVLDKNGNSLPIKLPTGFHLDSFILPDEERSKVHTYLPENTLFDVEKAGLHGISDIGGQFVVPPDYDLIQGCGRGLYVLRRKLPNADETKFRFFDASTRYLSTVDFAGESPYYGPYSEGLICYTELPKRGKANFDWHFHGGYCDIDHKIVIPALFGNIGAFKDGLAVVSTTNEAITSTGGGLKATDATGTRRVFIDKSGTFVSPDIIPLAQFEEGLAVAATADKPKMFGFIDRNFRFTVPAKYEFLERVVPGVYAAKEPGADGFIALDLSGNKMFDFPKGTLSFGSFDSNGPDSDAKYIIAKVDDGKNTPPDGFLSNDCLIDKQGNVLIPPQYGLRLLRFGMVDASSGYRSDRKNGVMDSNGKCLIPFQSAYFDVVEPDRIIKTVLNTKFSSDDWKKSNVWAAKWDMFAWFLKEYDFIGMPYAKVITLLGKGDELTDDVPPNIYRCNYTLLSGPCGRGWRGMTVEFENRIVKRWRFARFMEQPDNQTDWFTKNMIYDPNAESSRERMIRKQATLPASNFIHHHLSESGRSNILGIASAADVIALFKNSFNLTSSKDVCQSVTSNRVNCSE